MFRVFFLLLVCYYNTVVWTTKIWENVHRSVKFNKPVKAKAKKGRMILRYVIKQNSTFHKLARNWVQSSLLIVTKFWTWFQKAGRSRISASPNIISSQQLACLSFVRRFSANIDFRWPKRRAFQKLFSSNVGSSQR